ncbi:site-specific integrase [Roseibium sp.]|uniref:site-specific integrase n=1 Tax=Roseibium sp. TaxID=1936156 RepID=UPI003BA94304
MNSKVETSKKPTDPSKITIGEILSRYADDCGPTQKDPARTAYAIEALAPWWGDLTPDDITIARIHEYQQLRKKSNGTIRRELGVLRAALNHAEIELRLPNPPKIKLPKKPPPRSRWLTEDEANRLWRHAPPHLQRFILISLYTGRRKRAVLDLRWSPSANHGWIDLNRSIISFIGMDETESGKKRGSIAMPKPLLDSAAQWEQDRVPSVIHYKGDPVKDIKSSFKIACRDAGLSDVTPHTLKHTAVTWAFQKGMRLEDAADYFATSIETLMEVYRQHSPHYQDRAISVMNQIGKDFIADNIA